MPTDAPLTPRTTGPLRWLLFVVGSTCTTLGAIGAFLPVLPTTPFLLLAMACFARASPRLHRSLLENRLFGPYLAQWQRDRSIPRGAKRKAYGLVVVAFALSIAWVDKTWLRVGLAALGIALLAFLRWLPTTKEGAASDARSDFADSEGEDRGADADRDVRRGAE